MVQDIVVHEAGGLEDSVAAAPVEAGLLEGGD